MIKPLLHTNYVVVYTHDHSTANRHYPGLLARLGLLVWPDSVTKSRNLSTCDNACVPPACLRSMRLSQRDFAANRTAKAATKPTARSTTRWCSQKELLECIAWLYGCKKRRWSEAGECMRAVCTTTAPAEQQTALQRLVLKRYICDGLSTCVNCFVCQHRAVTEVI